MFTVLTPTGARPKAWAICEHLMSRQSYAGRVHWIIVDDGPEPQQLTFERSGWDVTVIRPQPCWQPGENTQARNILAGLAHVDAGDRLVIFEDDDHYSPDWLVMADQMLDHAELVGEIRARYYNIKLRRGRELENTRHACLSATALRGKAIALLRDACRDRPNYIDLELWRRHRFQYLFGGHRVVGMKGLPGRPGIGIGHRDNFVGIDDPDGALLREWIGADADLYQ